jgi:hypothetical protein
MNLLTTSRSQTPLKRSVACASPVASGRKSVLGGNAIAELTEAAPLEDSTVADLLRDDSSPIYFSRPGSTLLKRGAQPAVQVSEDYWVDVERNLRCMDRQNDACFTDWIRDEHNLTLSLPHLKRVMFDYQPERIVNGLRWLILEWRLASIAAAIKYLLVDDLWTVAPKASENEASPDVSVSIGGVRYAATPNAFRLRIHIIMALIDGWNYVHVKELFYFLHTNGCQTPEQSAFLLQALLLAFPEASVQARRIKQRLIQDFFP